MNLQLKLKYSQLTGQCPCHCKRCRKKNREQRIFQPSGPSRNSMRISVGFRYRYRHFRLKMPKTHFETYLRLQRAASLFFDSVFVFCASSQAQQPKIKCHNVPVNRFGKFSPYLSHSPFYHSWCICA